MEQNDEFDKIIQGMLQEITPNASDRFRQIKYEKVFYGIPDSIFDSSFRGIDFCYTFGFFEACISLIGTCLEKALKSELVRSYTINDKDLEKLSLGDTIKKAKDKELISNDILSKAWRVNAIRKKYVHVDIIKIKEIFRYNTYYQIRDRIQTVRTEREAEPDCLEAYKNLMNILENLYSEERYPIEEQ